MAAPLKINRELADKVRKLALTEIVDILENTKDYGADFRKQLLLKLAPTVLPRINEHTGEGGSDLVVKVMSYGNSDNLNSCLCQNTEKDAKGADLLQVMDHATSVKME